MHTQSLLNRLNQAMLLRIQLKLLVINLGKVKKILNQSFQHKRAVLLLLEHFLDHVEVFEKFTLSVFLELLSKNELAFQLV